MRLAAFYSPTRGEIFDGCAALGEQIIQCETTLLATIYSDPSRGIPLAMAAGVTRDHFCQPDLRLLFIACDVCRDRDADMLVYVSYLALRDAGLWNPGGAIHLAPGWSFESLSFLRGMYYHCPLTVRYHAKQLLDAIARADKVECLLNELRDTLSAIHPPAVKPPALPTVKNRPGNGGIAG